MKGAAKEEYVMGWEEFVAMKQSITPATSINDSFLSFSLEFQVCLLFPAGTPTGTIYNIIYDIILYFILLQSAFYA